MKIIEIAYHRNGVAGEVFDVVKFRSKGREMVAALFEGRGQVAVFDLELLAKGIVAFGENSWRGDNFEAELRAAIAAQDSQNHDDIQNALDNIKVEGA